MPTILTEEQANERLNSSRNLVNRFGKDAPSETPSNVTVIPVARNGSRPGDPRLNEVQKIEVAVRRAQGETITSLAMDYNVHKSSISDIEHGRTKYDKDKVASILDEVQDTALIKLMLSLNLIDQPKLAKLGAKDLANFAASMSKVVGNTRASENNGDQVHLHLYSPELRLESAFKTIEVRGG